MSRGSRVTPLLQTSLALILIAVVVGLVGAFTVSAPITPHTQLDMQKLLRGRQIALEYACGACHGGAYSPDMTGWMMGMRESRPDLEFLIGPCLFDPAAQPCFRTRPRNLTPDNLTGMGRFTERQIFNALRHGLRPGETADVEITSSTPGQGNFPLNPKYLAPPMPWPAWRHMPDEDLWAIAYYLKNGVEPVRNRVADSDGPPDFWASAYTPEMLGPRPPLPFPTANEISPTDPNIDLKQLLRGRQILIQHDCGACHIGGTNPSNQGWLGGAHKPPDEFPVGPCAIAPGTEPCYMQRPANLTPHATNGIGRYTDRQVFNALRYGLRPSTTPDLVITSSTPGQGNFPTNPDYLGLGMPWPAWRYMADEDLWAIIAYLRHGVRPIDNKVTASDAPPDLWASEYTLEKIGVHPAPPYPAAHEVGR
jgi:mono/diheme cytochrome c family protein